MTGWPASAIRAIVMVMVVYGGWALKRPTDLINSLYVAAIIILVWEPRQLFQAGFQLSFFVVLCIILILPPFQKLTARLLQTDPLLPRTTTPQMAEMVAHSHTLYSGSLFHVHRCLVGFNSLNSLLLPHSYARQWAGQCAGSLSVRSGIDRKHIEPFVGWLVSLGRRVV